MVQRRRGFGRLHRDPNTGAQDFLGDARWATNAERRLRGNRVRNVAPCLGPWGV